MKNSSFFHYVALAALLLTLTPTQGRTANENVQILKKISLGGQGAVSENNTLTVQILGNTTLAPAGFDLGGTTSNQAFSLPQYIKVLYDTNRLGYQSVIIATDNSATTANPKYTGFGDGAGLVFEGNTSRNAPLHWTVFPEPQAGGYVFQPGNNAVSEPIRTSNQFFVVDFKRPNGDAFPAGFASLAYGIHGQSADLPAAPTSGRRDENGEAYIYLGVNLKGGPQGKYSSNRLKFMLVTLDQGQIAETLAEQVLTVSVIKSNSA